jgi:uncharacterized protein (DUF433 family)
VAEPNYTSKYFTLEEIEKTPLEEEKQETVDTPKYINKYFDTPLSPLDEDPSFFETLGQTVDELQASGWAGWRVMGEAFGNERMIETGNRGIEINEAQAARYGRPMIIEDIEGIDDAMEWTKGAVAQVLPSIAVSVPTALIGAKLGAAAGSVVPFFGTLAGGIIGGALGAFLPSFFLGTGEIDREMKRRAGDDFSDPMAAMGGGAIVGALDTAALAVAMKGVLPHLLKRTAAGRGMLDGLVNRMVAEGVAPSVAKGAVVQGLKAAAMEGATEATQEWVEAWTAENATDVPTDQAELQSALINAFALGAVGGGPLGTVSGYKVARSRKERAEQQGELNEQKAKAEESLQEWVTDQGLPEMSLAQLKDFVKDTYPTLSLADYTTANLEVAVEDIIKAERNKRLTEQTKREMRALGLSETSWEEIVEEQLQSLETLSDEEIMEYVREQGIEDRIALVTDMDDIKRYLAEYEAGAQHRRDGKLKSGMDTFTFGQHITKLKDLTKEELMKFAEQQGFKQEELRDLEYLGQRELAAAIARRDAILEMNRENVEALSDPDRKKLLDLQVDDDQTSQNKADEEIRNKRAVEVKVKVGKDGTGHKRFHLTENGQYLDESGTDLGTFMGMGFEGESTPIITGITVRKGDFRSQQQQSFVGKLLSHFWGGYFSLSPSAPLGIAAFQADRRRISRLRTINKAAQDLGYSYEEAVLAALQNKEIATREEADLLVMDYLSQAQEQIPLTKGRQEEKQGEIDRLKTQRDALPEKDTTGRARLEKQINFLQNQISEKIDFQIKVSTLEQMPAGLAEFAVRARGLVDTLSERLLNELPESILAEKIGDQTRREVIRENLGKYLTQSFKIYEPNLGWNPLSWWNRVSKNKAAAKVVEDAKQYFRAKNGSNYALQEGDTVAIIAEKFPGITIEDIQAFNPTLPTVLRPGYDIYIPATEAEANSFINDIIAGKDVMGGIETRVMAGLRPVEKQKAEIELATGVLKERQKIPKEYRALMGEITDPSQVLSNTVTRVASILENMRFYEKLADFSNIPGQRLFSPFKTGQFTEQIEEREGLPIGGMWTTSHVSEAIGLQQKTKSLGWKLYENMILLPKIAVQAGKTVYSIAAQMRNFMSASLFFLGNGHINVGNFAESMRTLRDELFAGGYDTQGRPISRRTQAEKSYRKLLELGIINTNTRLGEIMSTFDEAIRDKDGDVGQFAVKLLSWTKKPFGRKITGLPQKLYMAADDFWKIAAWGAERGTMKSAFKPGSEAELVRYAEHLGLGEVITHKSYEDMIDEIAAYKVRQTIPNYDYVGNFAQRIRKSPLGNFIAFPTEIIRTSGNIMWQSYKDATFKGNLRIQGDGVKRGIGYGAATYGLSTVLTAIAQAINDIDDEEIEAARKFVGPWARHSPIIPISEKLPDGGFDYIDGSYIFVYDDLAKLIPMVMSVAQDETATGENMPPAVAYGLSNALLELLEPYYELSIAPEIMKNIMENRSDTGYNIGNPEAPWGDYLKDQLEYAWKKGQPGAAAQITRLSQGLAVDEEAFTTYGKLEQTQPALLSLMGMRTDRVNPTSGFRYKITDYQKGIRDAGYIFTDIANDFGRVTPEELLSAWDKANEATFGLQQELYFNYLAAQTLGSDVDALDDQLKARAGISAIRRKLEKGMFTPYKPPTTAKENYEDVTDKMRDKLIEEYGLDTVTSRHWPKYELRARSKYYRRGKFSLLLPFPPYLED